MFNGFNNVYGEDTQKLEAEGRIVNNNRQEIDDEYMPYVSTAEKIAVPFENKVNEWYEKINAIEDQDQKRQAAFRMASALFVGGVMIHPRVDGNGQTFKILVESYIHDLVPDLQDQYFPVKYSRSGWTPSQEMAVSFMGGGFVPPSQDLSQEPVTKMVPVSEDEQTVLDALDLMRIAKRRISEIEDRDDIKAFEKHWEKENNIAEKLGKVLSSELNEPEFKEVSAYVLNKGTFKGKERLVGSAENSLQRAAHKYLRKLGNHPSWEIRTAVFGGAGTKIERISSVVERIWNTDEGINFLDNYVTNGSTQYEGEQSPLFEKLSRVLELQRAKMLQTLETADIHEEKHKAAVDHHIV